MNRKEIHGAVLHFLDQYIARGADSELVAFRDSLSLEPQSWKQLDDLLVGDDWSEREAFRSMHEFFSLEMFRGRNSIPPIYRGVSMTMLVSDTDWYEPSSNPYGAVSSDPAQWYDWLDCVALVATTSPEN